VKADSSISENFGLAHWMLDVARRVAKPAKSMKSDDVHDLRVALRRCRSMADGFRAIDPDKNWKKMRRQATTLFDSLGALRDCHVMMEWVEKLGAEGDPLTTSLLANLRQPEAALQRQAELAIENFERKQWRTWSRFLPCRAARVPSGSEAFETLALEKLNAARRFQAQAMKTCGATAFHRLRIGLKKFRYVVENFLPRHHIEWKAGLKQVQDLLGEIHDLDVLLPVVSQVCADQPAEVRQRWEQVIAKERNARIESYRELMSGNRSLWTLWRSALPRGEAARQASLKRLQAWSSFHDSDLRHSRRVARFAVQIHDDLLKLGVLKGGHSNDRELLRAAAVVHEVGRANGDKNHHKKTERMIDQLDHVAGWMPQDMLAMARIARYHRGALPEAARLQDVAKTQRHRIRSLAAILRLANALDDTHDGSIRRIVIARSEGYIAIRAEGLQPQSALGEKIAGARHLLEVTCGLPILVRPLTSRRPRRRTLPSN
jgi:CHAD domain-containing protein